MERKNVWNTFSAKQLEEVDAFGKEYMYFLDHGKTERECSDLVVNMIEKEGYVELSQEIKKGKKQNYGKIKIRRYVI